MGFLRLLLASIVLASHSGITSVYSGIMAVECFFVISGFYMQLIISENYTFHKDWQVKFLISRFLRIFIPYWVVLITIVVLSAFTHHASLIASFSNPVSVFTNIFIVGTEHIKLWRLGEGCESFYATKMIIPQIWSVGIELIFYMTVPILLVLRSNMLIIITFLSLLGKVILLYFFHNEAFNLECGDGLLNGIFFLELGVFTVGALGCRIYMSYLKNSTRLDGLYPKFIVLISMATLGFILSLHYKTSPLAILFASYAYIAFLVIVIPVVFKVSKDKIFDKTIGDLSYTFYICHFYIVQNLFTHIHLSRSIKFLLYESVTILCAFIINKYIERPLDKIRHRYFK